MSVRVIRWDTGREAEVPEEALRWGPDTRQGTCRAALLRRPGLRADVALISDVPYVLPFEGAKWAVRVDIEPAAGPQGTRERPAPWYRCSNCGEWCHPFQAHFPCLGWPSEKFGALLEAAGNALRAEEERLKGARSTPNDTALSLLAECLDECLFPAGLSRRVQLFLERETAAEIWRAWKGGGRG